MPKSKKPVVKESLSSPHVPDGPVSFVSLEELCAAVAKPIDCIFEMGGQLVRVPVYRLTPTQTDIIESVRREVGPAPLIKGKTQLEDRYDTTNQEWQNKQLQANRLARALTVYFGCGLFNQARPGLTDRRAILEFVENPQGIKPGETVPGTPAITNVVLELIYLTIMGEAIRVKEEVNQRVNF